MDDIPNIPKIAFPPLSNSENLPNYDEKSSPAPEIPPISTEFNLNPNPSPFSNSSPLPNMPSIGIPQIGLSQTGIPPIGLSQAGIPPIGLSQTGIPPIGIQQTESSQTGIPPIGIQQTESSQTGIPPIGIPTLSSSGLPNSFSNISPNEDQPSVPSINFNLSTLSQSKRNQVSDAKSVIICLPFMNQINNKRSHKDMIQYFGDDIDFIDEQLNGRSLTIVESLDIDNNSIPSFQAIDTACQKVKHVPKMINRVNKETSHMIELIDAILSEIEKTRIEKEELLVQNALLKEKLRASTEEAEKFNQSAMNIKKNFDNFFSKMTNH